ncbi:MAG: arginine decarboxylase [Proteobacteria bacterium]|nr:MAG: arginine decarboxylase [Pseudomonadota bacterium]
MTAEWYKKARAQYNIPYWSDDYVDIDPDGDVIIRPHRKQDHISINLPSLVKALKNEALGLPVLVRFSEILHDRVNTLCNAFNQAAREQSYQGNYSVVYPIKVNQQRRVVEEIISTQPAADRGQIGLEAGSKPELLAVLALTEKPGSVIVCNGYKDREYIRLALLGIKMGFRVFIVIEKSNELPLILEESTALAVTPKLGVRVRLSSIGKGNWQNTGGEKSKFGLSPGQLLKTIETLKKAGAENTLELLHFHLGSQIGNIRDIQNGLRECARYYSQLRASGVPVNTVDIGGGLGVDYEGTRSRSACSINYSIADYARTVITTLRDECVATGTPHPDIISESGRALTAHHAVLITNVIDIERIEPGTPSAPAPDDPPPLQNLWADYRLLTSKNSQRAVIEIYHEAAHAITDVNTLFNNGSLGLQQKARAERIYQAICILVRDALSKEVRAHREVSDELNEKLADKLFVNLSLFQSLPDVWGIDQIFPILPLQNLNTPITQRAVLQDVTCDSDGRIDHYVDELGIDTTLPLPLPPEQGPYLLGFFLTGAYQEILGDMHNLFGDTNSIDVVMTDDGGYQFRHPIRGDTVDDVLRYVKFEPDQLVASFRQTLSLTDLTGTDKSLILKAVAEGLKGYTYLE